MDVAQYLDSAEVVKLCYGNSSSSEGCYNDFIKLESWLASTPKDNENKPLVIVAPESVSMKHFLINWLNHHEKNQTKNFLDYTIFHFASQGGNNSIYFHAIFKILTRIREKFNIKQKVELVEEKLRKYFHYWLDVCSRKIKKNVLYDGNVNIVFEGIDLFLDTETQDEPSTKFWLPKTFPDRIKCIVTVSPQSRSYQYLESIGCTILKIEPKIEISDLYIKEFANQESLAPEQHRNRVIEITKSFSKELLENTLFMRKFINCFCPTLYEDHILTKDKLDYTKIHNQYNDFPYEKIENINTIQKLLETIFEFYNEKICEPEKFNKTICYLCLTNKGLSIQELVSQSGLQLEDVALIQLIFKEMMIVYEGYWNIIDQSFKSYIMDKCYKGYDLSEFHANIALTQVSVENSVRKQEEEIFHLFHGQQYFRLKQTISNIENFLQQFNPYCKYDLCMYWQFQEQIGHEPVSEYCKSVETFEKNAQPSPEDLFKIILQLSRFLKEFGDFETKKTPEFRHPGIRNKLEIGTNKNNNYASIYYANKKSDAESKKASDQEKTQIMLSGRHSHKNSFTPALETIQSSQQSNQESDDDCDEKFGHGKRIEDLRIFDEDSELDLSNDEIEDLKKSKLNKDDRKEMQNMINYLEDIGLLKEIKRLNIFTMNDAPKKILADFEQYNVDIPSQAETFRKVHMDMIYEKINKQQEYIKSLGVDNQPYSFKIDDDLGSQEESRNSSNPFKSKKSDYNRNNTSSMVQRTSKGMVPAFADSMGLAIEPERSASYYHYKRWIWIIFPWICMSVDPECRFSDVISKCYSSATKYMSVKAEREFTSAALKIAFSSPYTGVVDKERSKHRGGSQNRSVKNSEILSRGLKEKIEENRMIQKKMYDKSKDVDTNKQEIKGFAQILGLELLCGAKSINMGTKNKLHTIANIDLDEPKKFRDTIFTKGNDQSYTPTYTKTFNVPNEVPNSDRSGYKPFNNLQQGGQFSNTREYYQPKLNNNIHSKSTINLKKKKEPSYSQNKQGYTTHFPHPENSQSQILKLETQPGAISARSKFFNQSRLNTTHLTHDFNLSKTIMDKTPVLYHQLNSTKFNDSLLSYKTDRTQKGIEKFQKHLNEGNFEHLEIRIKILEEKIKDFINEHNRLFHEKKKVQQFFKNKQIELVRQEETNAFKTQEKQLVSQHKTTEKSDKLEEQIAYGKVFKLRMSRIIEVCKINKFQNNEWINKLNFLSNNYSKTISSEKLQIKKNERRIDELKATINSYVEAYNDKLQIHKDFINQINFQDKMKNTLNNVADDFNSSVQNNSVVKFNEMQAEKELGQKEDNAASKKKAAGLQDLKLKQQIKIFENMKGRFMEHFDIDVKNNPDKKYGDFLNNLEQKRDLECEKLRLKIILRELKHKKHSMGIVEKQNELIHTPADNHNKDLILHYKENMDKLTHQKAEFHLTKKLDTIKKESDTIIKAVDSVNLLMIKLNMRSGNPQDQPQMNNLFFDNFEQKEIFEKLKSMKQYILGYIKPEEYKDLLAKETKPINVAEKYVKLEEGSTFIHFKKIVSNNFTEGSDYEPTDLDDKLVRTERDEHSENYDMYNNFNRTATKSRGIQKKLR